MSVNRIVIASLLIIGFVIAISVIIWYVVEPEIQFFIYWVIGIIVAVLSAVAAIVQISGYSIRDILKKDSIQFVAERFIGEMIEKDDLEEVDLLIIIALDEEFEVFEKLCELGQAIRIGGDYINPVNLPNMECRVIALMLGGMGTTDSGAATQKILNQYHPRLLVSMGIAGRLDTDLMLGDVVVANEVAEFQAASKATQKGQTIQMKYSGKHWAVPFKVYNPITQFRKNFSGLHRSWQSQVQSYKEEQGFTPEVSSSVRERPKYFVGHIASGNTVAASETYTVELLGLDRKFLAIEMEAAGVVTAATRQDDPYPFLIIRGISDYAHQDKGETDSIGGGIYRQYAMYSAVSFFLHLLQTGDILTEDRPDPLHVSDSSPEQSPSPILPSSATLPATPNIFITHHPEDKSWAQGELGREMQALGMVPLYQDKIGFQDGQEAFNRAPFTFFIVSRAAKSEALPLFATWLGHDWQLLQERRRCFLLCRETVDLPTPLNALYSVKIDESGALPTGLKLLVGRIQSDMPEFHTTDLWIQTIMEELQMGQQEYSRHLKKTSTQPNIFAVMYLSAQLDLVSELAEEVSLIFDQIPTASFQDMGFVNRLLNCLEQVEKLAWEIHLVVETGLRVHSEHTLGLECEMTIKFILSLVETEMPLLVKQSIGNSFAPNSLSVKLDQLSRGLEDFHKQLSTIHDLTRKALAEPLSKR